MIWVAKVLFAIAMAGLLWQRLKTLLAYFQQEEYDPARFVASVQTVRLFDVRATVAILVALSLVILGMPMGLALVVLALVVAGIAYAERGYRFKKPLALTERARRILYLGATLMAPVAVLTLIWPLLALIAIQVGFVALISANALLKPLQARVNDNYVSQARAKLARLDPIRIGITGSFGKTTVKHILADVLEAAGPVFYSRGSINTVLGLTRHIRQRLQWSHRYFVAEMGAYGLGSIKRLCDFVEPTYGIVTAVGDAHTERFGSVEVIAQAKSELVSDVMARDGRVVVNADVLKWAPFERLKAQHGDRIVSVARIEDATQADVLISSTLVDGGVWSITLSWHDGRMADTTYELPLLGDHNVMNSALAVVLTLLIDAEIAQAIPFFTKTVAQVPHRLQKIDNQGTALILDDAYNANELGFKSAVATMKDLANKRQGRAILVTPGLVELGLEHDPVHARLGAYCGEFCDTIYVVNPNRIRSFTNALDRSLVKVVEVSSFLEARQKIASELKPEDVVLYENDLPDLLEEKRLL